MADRVVAVAAVDRLRSVGGAGDDLVVAEAADQGCWCPASRTGNRRRRRRRA